MLLYIVGSRQLNTTYSVFLVIKLRDRPFWGLIIAAKVFGAVSIQDFNFAIFAD